MNEDDPVITLENIHYYEKQRTNHFILIQQLNILLEQTILNERKEYGKIFHNKINIPLYINIHVHCTHTLSLSSHFIFIFIPGLL